MKKHRDDFSAVLFPCCHISVLRDKNVIFRNTGKPALSRGISSLFTALSERACRDRAASSLVTSGHSGNQQQRKWAIKIKNWPAAKQGDIGPGARVGKSITIHGNVNIGENVIVRQNTTTGEKVSDSRENYIVTGDNVCIRAHMCII